MNGPVRVEMLGGLRVRVGDRTITRFTTRHAASLLAFLAFYRHQSHPREVLYEMLWPGVAPKDGRARLSTALSSLRRQLEPPGTPAGAVLQATYFAVGVNPAAVTTDVAEFLAALKAAERARDRAERVRHRRRAVDLYQGELLPGFYEDWVLTEQRRLADLGEGAREEWDATGEGGAVPPAPPDPEPDVCVTAAATATVPSLPLVFTRFFGREEEIARLAAMLLSPDARLITLSGGGGMGKTRLAREVAARLADCFPGGVYFAPLADLRYARLIGGALADALGLPRQSKLEPLEQAIQALSDRPSLLVLDNFEHLVDEGAAVVRTLIERAPSLTVLVTSRRLLDLTAEREFPLAPLPTPGERETAETAEGLPRLDSVRLFVDRAQAARPDFQVTERNAAAVAALVTRLEGIPLAIELAAARALVLSPAQMLALLSGRRFAFLVGRKRDVAGRHRSLLAALGWSYDLLSPALQRFFSRLSVFRGGWTVEAAEAVCEEPRALEYLEHLRASSLVLAEQADAGIRFRMLETVREFGEERLPAEDGVELRRRHASFFLHLVTDSKPGPDTAAQRDWFDRLERENDNLRAALLWCRESPGDAITGLRLGTALEYFWTVRGYAHEGAEHLGSLLAREEVSPPTVERANALNALGLLKGFVAGRTCFEESLEIRRAIGDLPGVAGSLNNLGNAAKDQGDYATARALYEESLALRRRTGDLDGIAAVLGNLGSVHGEQGDYEGARRLHAESLAIERRRGDALGIAMSLLSLGLVAYEQGDLVAAHAHYAESLAIRRELGDKWGVALALNNLGIIAQHQDGTGAARALYAESLAIRRELQDEAGVAQSLANLGAAASDEGDVVHARALFGEAFAIWHRQGAKRYAGIALENLAIVADAMGDSERAVRLFGAAERLRDVIGAPLPLIDQAEHEKNLAGPRERLGEAAFAAAWEAGRALTWAEVAACVLGDT